MLKAQHGRNFTEQASERPGSIFIRTMDADLPKVLVTGSTGHLGSWLVMRLLEKGYRVKASVLNADDKQDLHPFSLISPSKLERLEIVKADLLVEGDFDDAVQGCDGVFHLACPTNFSAEDPQKQAINPAVQGTLNVLRSCIKTRSVKRVLHVSSAGAIRTPGKDDADRVFDESCWTDVDFCLKSKMSGWPYFVAKTLGERAAVEFARMHNLDLVVANPTLVTGPFLLPRIPNSIKDALALVTEARGRYVCSAVDASITDVADIIRSQLDLSYLGEPEIHYFDSSKLKTLGFQYKYTLKDMLLDAIECCKEKGLL
ncbi:hypothetical protein GOP47_0006357 [Adiantum capillus-veneris]|uniref:Flavanone 4-reductase n=1 Tax=Adiantum capillus-veneris TaxID=13818 RepID=A0A9D4ZME9_ADICA|nr:hypothetical protein GOP47_0006357 [Adiantum capillus-veneris]